MGRVDINKVLLGFSKLFTKVSVSLYKFLSLPYVVNPIFILFQSFSLSYGGRLSRLSNET